VARIQPVLAEIDHREGHTNAAVTRLEAVLEALAGEEPDEDTAAVAGQLGRFLMLSNRDDEAAPHLEAALELAEALRLPEVFAQALTTKSVLYTRHNRLDEARILLEGALAGALASDLNAAAMRAINNLAVNYESGDRYRDANEATMRGVAIARRVGDRGWELNYHFGTLSALVLLGEWDEAVGRVDGLEPGAAARVASLVLHVVGVDCARGNVSLARRRLDDFSFAKTSDDPQSRLGYTHAEAIVLRAEGRPREALAAAEIGFAVMARGLGSTFLNVKLCFVEGLEAAFEAGDTAKAEELLGTIESLRPGERPRLLEAHAHRFRAKLTGDEKRFRAAEELFRELELPFDLAVTLLEHGEATASDALVAEAREIFERLGATPWVERAGGVATGVEVGA
jgi:tetratricopeptide (TPR) repeat protein